MRTVSEMTEADKRLHGHSENKERYIKANRWRRELTLQQAYALRDALDEARTTEERDSILGDWAQDTGQSVKALKEEARWTDAIKLADIYTVFAEKGIDDTDWQMRIGVSHVKQAAIARDQATGRSLTSREKAELLLNCYNANWKVEEFKADLRRRKLKRPERAKMARPIQKDELTICTLLEALSGHIKGEGKNIPLTLTSGAWDRPVKVHRLLQRVTDLIRDRHPDLTYRPPEEETPDGTSA